MRDRRLVGSNYILLMIFHIHFGLIIKLLTSDLLNCIEDQFQLYCMVSLDQYGGLRAHEFSTGFNLIKLFVSLVPLFARVNTQQFNLKYRKASDFTIS
jgi:hypothetical protein